MTPLPLPLGSGELMFWRLDQARFASAWDSGEGSHRVGGRWSPRGLRAVYAALDPATAILEVAVHTGFRVLDMVPRILTCGRVVDLQDMHVVTPKDVPNPNWLRPVVLGMGQQAFGHALLSQHAFVLIPSVISTRSWNVVFDPARAQGRYDQVRQERFALDPRPHPAR